MEFNTGISEQNRQDLSIGLNRLLADTYAMYLKTQNFHWNLTGPHFYSLHILFEKQYEELAEAIDEIAERVRALGFYVEASFSSFKRLTLVEEDDKVLNIKEMIHSLLAGHQALIRHARTLAEVADKHGDFATVDMIGKRLAVHEKSAWMLSSVVGNGQI